MTEDPLHAAVSDTITQNPDQVRRWQESLPGTWGYLAGQGILAYKRLLGRPLRPEERRALWDALWRRLEEQRSER